MIIYTPPDKHITSHTTRQTAMATNTFFETIINAPSSDFSIREASQTTFRSYNGLHFLNILFRNQPLRAMIEITTLYEPIYPHQKFASASLSFKDDQFMQVADKVAAEATDLLIKSKLSFLPSKLTKTKTGTKTVVDQSKINVATPFIYNDIIRCGIPFRKNQDGQIAPDEKSRAYLITQNKKMEQFLFADVPKLFNKGSIIKLIVEFGGLIIKPTGIALRCEAVGLQKVGQAAIMPTFVKDKTQANKDAISEFIDQYF